MKTVQQILDNKRKEPTIIEPGRPVLDALRLMGDADVGAVLVIDGGVLVGVVSERDYVRGVARGDVTPETVVGDVMTAGAITVTAKHSIEECMALMMLRHVRHLPVVKGGGVIGVISIRDVVRAVLDEREYRIDQLENYIAGR